MKKLIVFIGLMANITYADYKPDFVYQTDPYFGHHVIVAEKASHTLFLYEHDNNFIKLLKKYPMATGLVPGDKKVQGDRKTPEGIYLTTEFLSAQDLLKRYGDYGKMYGSGAFTLDYPNAYDLIQGKTGSGIWLHSTDDETRISKRLDSKGCVVVNDKNLAEISKFVELGNTTFIITNEITYLSQESWERNKTELTGFIESWKTAWNKSDFENYIKHYSPKFFDNSRGNLSEFTAYKRNIFKADLEPVVNLDHISIFALGKYAVAIMRQDYKSKTINDIGKKVLYLVQNSRYEWKIVRELWSDLKNKGELKFSPPQDYFNLSQAK